MKKGQWFVYAALCLAMTLVSCASVAPIQGSEGQGAARLADFTIAGAENSFIKVASIVCRIEEGVDSGLVQGILPAGTKTLVAAKWSVKKGSLWIDGVKASAGTKIDLGSVKAIDVVDAAGKIRSYALDIKEAPIPTVYIATENAAPILTKTDWVKGQISIVGGQTKWASALGPVGMKTRGRGNSTWGMPKKPYRFTLDESASIFGLPKAKKWVLLANYADKSLMRNFVAFSAAPVLDNIKYSPRQHPVILYLNGEYLGIYGLGEQVETGKGRVEIAKPDDSPETSFFIEVNMRIDSEREGGVLGRDFFMTPGKVKMEYKTPDTDEVTPAQHENIAAFVAKAEAAILAGSGYEEYIDVGSFIDWLILEELFKNQDSIFLSSVFIHRPKGGKLTLGPPWDFDLSAGNSDYGAIGKKEVKDPEGWFPLYSEWFSGLYRDRGFRRAVAARWSQKRDALEAAIKAAIEEYAALLAPVQADNFAKWQIMGRYVWPNPPELVAAATHEAQVEALKTWFAARFTWMDGAMEEFSRAN